MTTGTLVHVDASSRPHWVERHDGPPSIADAQTLVVSNRCLALRATLPTGLIAVLIALAGWSVQDYVVSSVIAGLLLAASIARTTFWIRGFGRRRLVATRIHLVLCKADEVEQWVAWEDIESVLIVPSDPLPEWSRTRTDWFHVIPQPELAVMPPSAFVSGFGDMLLSSRASRAAIERVRSAVEARGISWVEL